MSKKNKLKRFAEMLHFPNVYQNFSFHNPKITGLNNETKDFKGFWSERCFNNSNALILELACGGGEYTVSLARNNPHENFVGIDIKGARIYKGAKTALEENIENAAFLRTRIELINYFFENEEVDEIWITFPDPFLKDSDENNRLTSPNFLRWILPILKEGGLLHLKTDSEELYEYSKQIFKQHSNLDMIIDDDDIYKSEVLTHPALKFKTYYEEKHLADGKKIKYLQVRKRV